MHSFSERDVIWHGQGTRYNGSDNSCLLLIASSTFNTESTPVDAYSRALQTTGSRI
jgi:hypothetical protein